jgi:hypothetical protein
VTIRIPGTRTGDDGGISDRELILFRQSLFVQVSPKPLVRALYVVDEPVEQEDVDGLGQLV